MKTSIYKDMKIAIFEKAVCGEITESERDELLTMLEAKKESDAQSEKDIKDFFDSLKDTYPALEDDIKKLQKKIEKSADDNDDESDDSDEKSDEGNDDEKEDEGEVSEAALELFELINQTL